MGGGISTQRQLVDEHGRNKLVKEENNSADQLNNNHIPMDLTAEILSRLPIKSMARFTSVSKSWRDLITTNMLARNNPYYTFFGTSLSPASRPSCKSSAIIQLYKNGPSANRVVVDSIPRKLIVGSCNGLLCIADHRFGFDRISFLNPITNEIAGITHSNYDGRRSEARYRFGYSPSTNEYKVLRSFTNELGLRDDQYAIFTVGADKTWRDLSPGLFPEHMSWHAASMVTCSCNGALYWLAGNNNNGDPYYSFVLAFDIAEESTRTIPFPNQQMLPSMVSGDPLCLHYCVNNQSADVVWKMEEGGRWSRIVLPASLPYRDFGYNVSAVCAERCGVVLSCVLVHPTSNEAVLIRLYWSGKHTATRFRQEDTELQCEFTPTFCSINEIVGRPTGR